MLSNFINKVQQSGILKIQQKIQYKNTKLFNNISFHKNKNLFYNSSYQNNNYENQQIQTEDLEQQIQELTLQEQEKLEKKYHSKYTKNKAIPDVVEQMFYPDHAEITQRQILAEIKKEQNIDSPDQKYHIDQETANELLALGGSSKTALQNKGYTSPETREDIIPAIQNIFNNDHLLSFYLKYNKLFGKSQLIVLLMKIQENLSNQDEIKQAQIQAFLRKKEKLKAIDENIELTFPHKYISREKLMEHDAIRHIQNKINYLIQYSLSARSTCHIMFKLFQFTKNIQQELISNFITKVKQDMDNLDVFPLMQIIRISIFYPELKMSQIQAKQLQSQALQVLTNLQEKQFNNLTILTLMRSMLILPDRKPITYPQLFQKLEPLILKNLSLYNFKQASDIFLSYHIHQQGSSQFYNFIIMDLFRKIEQASSAHNIILILNITKRQQINIAKIPYSLEIIYEPMLQKVFSLLPLTKYNPNQLNMILSSMTQNFIVNTQYYQIIAGEFLKNIEKFNLKRFSNCYFWISMSGISSKALVIKGMEKILIETQIKEKELNIKLSGLIEDKTDGETKKMTKSNFKSTLNYENQLLQQITHFLKSIWGLIAMIVRENYQYDLEMHNYELISRNINIINDLIDKLTSIKKNQIVFKRFYLELMQQINQYVEIFGNNILVNKLHVEKIMDKNNSISLQTLQFPEPKTNELSLYLLEKKYFILKYLKFLERDPVSNGIHFHWKLSNPNKGIETYIYLNEYENKISVTNAKGLIDLRQIFIDKSKTPCKTFELKEFLKFLENGNVYLEKNVSYFEYILQGLIPNIHPENNLENQQPEEEFQQQINKLKNLSDLQQSKLEEEIEELRKQIYLAKGRVYIQDSNVLNNQNSNQNQQKDEFAYDDKEFQLVHDEEYESEYELTDEEDNNLTQKQNKVIINNDDIKNIDKN